MDLVERLILIVDGNNLAHYLYHLPSGRTLAEEDVLRLAVHLAHYARQAQPPVTVELCLDPLPEDCAPPVLSWLRYFIAPSSGIADDQVRERFRYHQHRGAKYYAITNDSELREDIIEEGGIALPVSVFVRRGGKTPVFCQPGELKFIRSRRPVAESPAPHDDPVWDLLVPPANSEEADSAPLLPTLQQPVDACISCPQPVPDCIPAEAAKKRTQVAYRLALQNWPPAAGLRFLLDSFCAQHAADVRQLFAALAEDEIRSNDLRDLANLLKNTCGSEPDFARQGALMKRVRLALLLAGEQPLTLAQIIEKTQLPVRGLQGRIREKAAPWIEILPPEED